MRVNTFNSTQQSNNSVKNYPSFQMKLEVKGNALSYYEKRIGQKLNVNSRLTELKDGFEKMTKGIRGKAVIEMEEGSMEKPELIVNGLKCKKYPVAVTASDLLPEPNLDTNTPYSLKHLISGAYRIKGENGQGFGKNNVFGEVMKKIIGQ